MRAQTLRKILVLAALVVLVVLFFAYDLQQFLTLDYLKAQRDFLQELHDTKTFLFILAYFLFYILLTALNLPGAVFATLAGGMFMGFWPALVVISLASTIGATLACMLSRYLLRDWVRKKFGSRLERVNRGVEEEGAFYLFTMRLIPAIPFFLVNMAMGLTPMRLRTYFWVSQLGMLPGTAVYVNAGTQLGRISSPGDILSWQMLLSFALLGVFPLAAKKVVRSFRARKHPNGMS